MPPTQSLPTLTYDPTSVSISFANATIVGLAKGSFVKVSRDSDAYTDDVGVNGDVVRVYNADKRGKIEITLMRSSPSNDVLSAQAQLDALSGTGVASVQVRDNSGRTVHSGESCWVMKPPDDEFSTEATTITWILRVAQLNMSIGGTN